MDLSERYASLLQSLLPSGAAWTPSAGSKIEGLLLGLSDELARVDGRARKLIDEADPRTTLELIESWERIVEIPDQFQGVANNINQRRIDVLRKLAARGGQNAQYFVELAALFGYEVEIKECREFRCGIGRMGDFLYGDDFSFHWRLIVKNQVGPLPILESVIQEHAPAHTHALFTYGG